MRRETMTIPPADETAAAPAFLADPPAPLDGFPAEEFRARRDRLRAACPDSVVVIRGSREDEFMGASTYRQNSSLFYLTGVETPGAFLVLLPGSVPARTGLKDTPIEVREILFLPARNASTETWSGPQIGPGEATEKATGIQKVADAGAFWSSLTGWIRRCPFVSTLTPYGDNAATSREYAMMRQIATQAPAVQFRDAAMALARQRSVKSPLEIERIRQAIEITAEGQRVARTIIATGAGRWEYEIEAKIFETFRSRNATLAFASIVGGGPRGTVLHYEKNNQRLQEGDLVVVDIGARFGYYCGDLTRAYPVGGTLSPRQREIYSLVLDAHERVVSSCKPGEDTLKSLSDRCKDFLKDSPLRSRNEKGEEQTMNLFMPHGLSHHLGLDVHDVGDPEEPLRPGNVITVEPGLYLPGEGIGVRIEDDYVVTATGLERLGPELEKEIAQLETIMRS
jgi:Xaa-Pro aminopeptidase